MTTYATLAERRAAVASLAANNVSLRNIARQVGVGKDTVRRDLAALNRDSSQQHATPNATDGATPRETPAPASHGDLLTVPVDQELLDDLAVIVRTGRTPADAIGHAVHTLATIYRGAWTTGAYPEGTEPDIIGHQLKPYQG
ncbi:hypothetical protein [Streptomyces scopuliridis]|uniref:hypothetical protein n=1 Tax=Streptomyces scopuliridis TaxID=452529 RepID=UPI0036AED952